MQNKIDIFTSFQTNIEVCYVAFDKRKVWVYQKWFYIFQISGMITFANILQHDVFPLARILQLVLKYGEQEMRRPVEIEFAATLSREHDKSGTFYLLQIRPIVDSKEMLDEDLNEIPDENVILRSYNSLGHGIMNEVYDVVYVKTDNYSASNNQTIAWVDVF